MLCWVRMPTVPQLLRSYAALRLPRPHRPALRFPLRWAYLEAGYFLRLLHASTRCRVSRRRPTFAGVPACIHSGFARGGIRVSQVSGLSSSCVPWSTTPPDAPPPRPLAGTTLLPSGVEKPSASGKCLFSRLQTPWPTCSRTYASPARLPRRRKVRYRPAGLSFSRAGCIPAGQQTEFQSVIASLLPSNQDFLVAPQLETSWTVRVRYGEYV